MDYPVVIGDLSFFDADDLFFLLKFIEETKLKIVLLSKFDNVSPIVLSRMKSVVKYVDNVDAYGSTEDLLKAREHMEMKIVPNTSLYDKVRLQKSLSPILYRNDKQYKRQPNLQKLLSIIESPKGGF